MENELIEDIKKDFNKISSNVLLILQEVSACSDKLTLKCPDTRIALIEISESILNLHGDLYILKDKTNEEFIRQEIFNGK